MLHCKTVRDVDVKDKNILVRADFNVPLVEDSESGTMRISSDLRIRSSLPTLKYLLEHHAAKIILVSHLGRPDGKPDPKLSLMLVAEKLAELLPSVPVNFVDQVSGPEVEAAVEDLPQGGILMLENLRFWPQEKSNSLEFAQDIVAATHAEIFVQDGFAVIHRAHASTDAITKVIPSVAGLLLEKEVNALDRVLDNPSRPFVVMIGGIKVNDKQPLIDEFLPHADKILVGGKIAADGYKSTNPKVYVAEDFDEDGEDTRLDIGPVSTAKFVREIEQAQTVLWNGCLGKVEDPTYATSSTILAKVIGENSALTSVICGGDTSGFVEKLRETDSGLHYTLVSTGGGAALEYLAGKTLPGIDGLEDL